MTGTGRGDASGAPTATVRDGPVDPEGTVRTGQPTLRWRSHAHSIEGIEEELARIWAQPDFTTTVDGTPGRRVAARTSVMNLVVIARRREVAERCAATIQLLTVRHPSRTIILEPADPDGPSWLDAQIQAHCVLPREDAPEICAETIHVTAGGEAGRHYAAIVTPLVLHDLPVTVWWPGSPPFGTEAAEEIVDCADRLIVDGAAWAEDGLRSLRLVAGLLDTHPITICDFALLRQARWREAIASIFDVPGFLPYVRGLRRIAVTYATHDETGDPRATNVVKPVYHVAWLASRLGLSVVRPLAPVIGSGRSTGRRGGRSIGGGSSGASFKGHAASLRNDRDVEVVIRPRPSPLPSGTTLRVELLAERRGSELRADVTAEAETVNVNVWEDGVEALRRSFIAPRRTDAELLAEAIEWGGPDAITHDAIRAAAAIAGGPLHGGRSAIASSAAGL